MNINKSEAIAIAESHVSEVQKKVNREICIQHDKTIEEDFGWIFFYNTKKFIETNDDDYQFIGGSPFIVDRKTRKIDIIGTCYSVERHIELYRKYGNSHPEGHSPLPDIQPDKLQTLQEAAIWIQELHKSN